MKQGLDRYKQRKSSLWTERSSWVQSWQELGDYLMPRAVRLDPSNRNKGTARRQNIYDSTATQALNVLTAGMMAGMTSPARPWFRLAIPDEDLMQHGSVKQWLVDVQYRMLGVFSRSNTYMALHTIYEDLGAFGTSCAIGMNDFNNLVNHYNSPIGEYALATDFRGSVDTVYREFEKTVGELVGEFGYNNCTATVRNMYDRGEYENWIPVSHVIEPRRERDSSKRDGPNKRFVSVYFESGCSEKDKLLRNSGFDDFPALCPRWRRIGGDVYGISPGMEAIGDIKQLQHEQLRKANSIDYMTKPPLQAPHSLRGKEANMMPGGITYVDQVGPANGVQSIWNVNTRLDHLLQDIQDVRERIRSAFWADMFLMLQDAGETRMTAYEVAQRNEEKMLMLGPVLERLHNELLGPLIDSTFSRMVEVGALPPPPPELEGVELEIEFVSMLAQAQRAVATNSIDRFVFSLGSVAQLKPDVLDKFNADEWADAYSDMLGIDPELIISGEQVAYMRNARAEQQQKQEMMAQAQMEADTAAKLGTVKTNEANAASDIINMFSGYGSPSAVEV